MKKGAHKTQTTGPLALDSAWEPFVVEPLVTAGIEDDMIFVLVMWKRDVACLEVVFSV